MSASSAKVRSETSSPGSSSRARCRRIGSPSWAILRMAMARILALEAAAPGDVGLARALIAEAGQREEGVAQAVQVDDQQAAQGLLAPSTNDLPFPSAADRARVVEGGGSLRPTREHEAAERGQLALRRVDRRFEGGDVFRPELSRAEPV